MVYSQWSPISVLTRKLPLIKVEGLPTVLTLTFDL